MGYKPLMEELFASGVMQMGPSRLDPARQVGVFNPSFVAGLPALRAAEMEKFRWLSTAMTLMDAIPSPVDEAWTSGEGLQRPKHQEGDERQASGGWSGRSHGGSPNACACTAETFLREQFLKCSHEGIVTFVTLQSRCA